jgi:hypothetical protein
MTENEQQAAENDEPVEDLDAKAAAADEVAGGVTLAGASGANLKLKGPNSSIL